MKSIIVSVTWKNNSSMVELSHNSSSYLISSSSRHDNYKIPNNEYSNWLSFATQQWRSKYQKDIQFIHAYNDKSTTVFMLTNGVVQGEVEHHLNQESLIKLFPKQ